MLHAACRRAVAARPNRAAASPACRKQAAAITLIGNLILSAWPGVGDHLADWNYIQLQNCAGLQVKGNIVVSASYCSCMVRNFSIHTGKTNLQSFFWLDLM